MQILSSLESWVSFSPVLLCRRDKKRFSFSLDHFPVPLHRRPQPTQPLATAIEETKPNIAPQPAKAQPSPVQSHSLPALPAGYTRLKMDTPARPRTKWGRMQKGNVQS